MQPPACEITTPQIIYREYADGAAGVARHSARLSFSSYFTLPFPVAMRFIGCYLLLSKHMQAKGKTYIGCGRAWGCW